MSWSRGLRRGRDYGKRAGQCRLCARVTLVCGIGTRLVACVDQDGCRKYRSGLSREDKAIIMACFGDDIGAKAMREGRL